MILKITLGTGHRGLDSYVTSKNGAILLLGNMGGRTPLERAREVAGLRSARPDLKKAVGHLILSHDPSLPDLTHDQWRSAIQVARDEHDLKDAPFCAVLHQDTDHRHVHLFFYEFGPTAAWFRTPKATKKTRSQRGALSANLASLHRSQRSKKSGSATVKKQITRAAVASEKLQQQEKST